MHKIYITKEKNYYYIITNISIHDSVFKLTFNKVVNIIKHLSELVA